SIFVPHLTAAGRRNRCVRKDRQERRELSILRERDRRLADLLMKIALNGRQLSRGLAFLYDELIVELDVLIDAGSIFLDRALRRRPVSGNLSFHLSGFRLYVRRPYPHQLRVDPLSHFLPTFRPRPYAAHVGDKQGPDDSYTAADQRHA